MQGCYVSFENKGKFVSWDLKALYLYCRALHRIKTSYGLFSIYCQSYLPSNYVALLIDWKIQFLLSYVTQNFFQANKMYERYIYSVSTEQCNYLFENIKLKWFLVTYKIFYNCSIKSCDGVMIQCIHIYHTHGSLMHFFPSYFLQ